MASCSSLGDGKEMLLLHVVRWYLYTSTGADLVPACLHPWHSCTSWIMDVIHIWVFFRTANQSLARIRKEHSFAQKEYFLCFILSGSSDFGSSSWMKAGRLKAIEEKLEVIEEQVDEERGKDEVTIGVFRENTKIQALRLKLIIFQSTKIKRCQYWTLNWQWKAKLSVVFLPAFGDNRIIPQIFCWAYICTFLRRDHCFLWSKGNSQYEEYKELYDSKSEQSAVWLWHHLRDARRLVRRWNLPAGFLKSTISWLFDARGEWEIARNTTLPGIAVLMKLPQKSRNLTMPCRTHREEVEKRRGFWERSRQSYTF